MHCWACILVYRDASMKRQIGWAVIASIAFGLSVPAAAGEQQREANWVESHETDDGKGRDFVDPDSVVRDGPLARIRIRTEFVKGYNSLQSGEGMLEIDCKANKARLLEMHLIGADGKIFDITKPGNWQPIVKTSPAYFAAQAGCGSIAQTPAEVPAEKPKD